MKKRVILAATLLVLAAAGSASAVAPTNLVNYYSFNSQTLLDESPTYSQNAGATNTDLTLNDPASLGLQFTTGINRSYDPAVTADYAVKVKGAHGSAANTQSLDWPTGDADLDLGQAFTIEMWIHSGDTGGFGGNTTVQFMNATNYGITLPSSPTTGTTIPTVRMGSGSVTGGVAWGAGWHHIALVVDTGAGTTTYYYDAGLEGQDVVAGTTVPVSTNTAMKMGVAAAAGYYPQSADMYLDDVAMWNVALDQATLEAHVATGYGLTIGTPPPTHHLGDANEDGAVDLQDFGLLKENFGIVTGAVWGQGDFNGDGGIDLQDFGILKDHFGHTNGSIPVTAVPEPATMSLLALAGLGLLRKRTR